MFVLFLIDSFASTAVKVQLGKDPSMKRIEETCAALGRMYVASKAPTLLLMLLFEYTAEEILVNKKRKHTQVSIICSHLLNFQASENLSIVKRPQIVQIKLIQSWNAEDFAPSFRDRFEKYVRTVEAIRDKLSAEIVSTLDGTITYKDFNKLSKVSKEFDKMCEEWSIEGADVSELSRKLVTAFRLRDNIKRYTDMLTKLSYNIQPVTYTTRCA